MATFTIPAVGEMVRVRSRRHVVEDVAPPKPDRPTGQHLVTLACIEDDSAGEHCQVLWEAEPDARVLSNRDGILSRVEAFDPPGRFAAWYYSVRWNALSAADLTRVQAPFRAGISVESYQFEPLYKALAQPRVRLFIADDVGLGKTIEAALIVRELMLRQRVRRVVVAAPASVLTQWRDELDTRFGLTFVVIDREYLRARRRERGWQFNPWKTHPLHHLPRPAARPALHGAAARAAARRPRRARCSCSTRPTTPRQRAADARRHDSAFTRTLRDLAPLFEHRIFLSATPHNGHSNSFSALMEILDPSALRAGLADRPGGAKDRHGAAPQVRAARVGVEFPEREVVRLAIRGLPDDDPDLVLATLLDDYCTLREDAAAHESKEVQQLTFLSMTTLRKRLLSSIRAFRRTLEAHRAGLDAAGREGGHHAAARRGPRARRRARERRAGGDRGGHERRGRRCLGSGPDGRRPPARLGAARRAHAARTGARAPPRRAGARADGMDPSGASLARPCPRLEPPSADHLHRVRRYPALPR
jgi:hypothetical protein